MGYFFSGLNGSFITVSTHVHALTVRIIIGNIYTVNLINSVDLMLITADFKVI